MQERKFAGSCYIILILKQSRGDTVCLPLIVRVHLLLYILLDWRMAYTDQ